MKTIIQQYAEFICDLQYEKIPEDAVKAAKACVLDAVGNMIYGRYSEMGERALKYIELNPVRCGEENRVYIPGGDAFYTENAVFVSEVMARCADLDDGHRYAMGHPGSVLVPAVLIYAQKNHKNGEDILGALIAGYEIYIRLGSAINPTSYRERGFESTSVTGAVACTASLAKLFDLDQKETENALGIAALFASGLIEYQNDGSMGKVLGGVWAVRTAIQAIRLAESSFTGAREALEGKKGFIQAFSNAPDPEAAVRDLGTKFRIGEVYFKMHACMRGLHASIDAVLSIRSSETWSAEHISGIEVHTTPFVGRLSKPHPETEIAAQSSVEFTVALAALKGHIASEEVLKEALREEDVYSLASKVRLIMDPKIEEYVRENPSHWGAAEIKIYLNEGRVLSSFHALPKGEAEDPFTWDELGDKFCRLLRNTPYEQTAEELCDEISHMEDWEDAGKIFQ